METAKNKKIFNIIMIAAILLIAAGGIFAVGSYRGWFDKAEDSFAAVSKTVGFVKVERAGVSFDLEEKTALKNGDIIETQKDSGASITAGENTYILNEKTRVKIDSLDNDVLSLSLLSGETFVTLNNADAFKSIIAKDWKFGAQGTVFSIDLQTGSMTVNVFEGTVTGALGDDGENTYSAKGGEFISIVANEATVGSIQINSLNDFNLENVKQANESHKLCFTNEEIDKIIEERNAEAGLAEGGLISIDGEQITDEGVTDKDGAADNKGESETGSNGGSADSSDKSTNKSDSSETTTKKNNGTQSDTTTKAAKTTTKTSQTTGKLMTCTIEIRCDTILQDYNGKPNIENLTPGKEIYVPKSGTVLARTRVQFTEGETAFDVLKRACTAAGIQIEYSWTPMYNSYYIEGINHLYEFDCGNESGWMYKVNGWFPNYGCSAYEMKEGDTMVWCYTCNGLGEDVGCYFMGDG